MKSCFLSLELFPVEDYLSPRDPGLSSNKVLSAQAEQEEVPRVPVQNLQARLLS
jgi:hypothetical protein